MTFSIYFLIILIIVLSMDAFTAGLSYGIENVQVPFLSLSIIALLSGSMLTASLLAGNIFLGIVPGKVTKIISFSVLFLLSIYKFYDAIPQLHKRENGLTTGNISRKVNKDDKAVLSGKEAAALSAALSIDKISAGLCTGTVSLSPIILLLLTIAIHFMSIKLGLLAGQMISRKNSHNLAWLSAAILLVMSFLRIL